MVVFRISDKTFKLKNSLTKKEIEILERPWNRSPKLDGHRDVVFNELMISALEKCFGNRGDIEQLTARQKAELFLNMLEYSTKMDGKLASGG